MNHRILLSILLLGGSAGVCAAQTSEPAPAAAPAAQSEAPPVSSAELPEAAAPADPPTPATSPATPSGPLVAYSGSMTQTMTAMSPGKAAFALVGAAAMIAEGKKIIEENSIVDPSQEMARGVAADLAQRTQARAGDAPLTFERKGLPKPAILAAAAPDAAYVVDVDSGWILAYFPVDWAKYQVNFMSNMRLVDTRTKTVVAKHFCNWVGEKRGDPKFTRDELLGDGAKGLKAALGRAADHCRGEFTSKVAETLGSGAGAAKVSGGS